MRTIIFIILALISCTNEDKFYRKKFDTEFFVTNRTDTVIEEIKIDAYYGVKVWTFKNVEPGNTAKLRLNIKRDIKTPEGSFEITAFFDDKDSVRVNTGYFTNWHFQGPNPSNLSVYRDSLVLEK